MPLTTYSYTVADTANNKVDIGSLHEEIQEVSAITIALDDVTVTGDPETPASAIDVVMRDALSPTEETALDGAIAAHQGDGADPTISIESVVVTSWNGQTGAVTADATSVGADPAGTAAAAVSAHEGAADPHPTYTTAAEAAAAAPVQSVNGNTGVVSLAAGDVGADPAGTAASAVSAHEAAGDPHPIYTTAAEASAAAPVQSVNSNTGAVVLGAADVGADPAGTGASEAASAVSAHEGAADPHPVYTTAAEAAAAAPVQSVNGNTGVVSLGAGDVGADPAGTGASEAASAVSTHEAAGDPHPGYILESREGVANGVATLDGSGNVPLAQLGNVMSGLDFQGTWNASTNTPSLSSGVGTNGHYYVVSVAGSTNLDGITDWGVGDWAVFNGTAWQKLDNSDAVTSVFGRTGAVVAQAGDYTAGQVGADPTGTAAAAVAAHEAAGDPHPQYTTTAEAAAAAPVQSVNGNTGVVVIPPATTSVDGLLSAADKTKLDGVEAGATADQDASEVSYSNATSGLTATDVQAAIDELAAGGTGDQALVQCRTGSVTVLNGTFQSLDWNTQDHENDTTVVERDDTNQDRIVFNESGFYEVIYSLPITLGSNDAASARARLNNSTTIPGSEKSVDSGQSASTNSVTTPFVVEATAGDFMTIEAILDLGSAQVEANAILVVIALKGPKGDKGDTGAGSSVSVENDGSPLAGGPFDTLNLGIGLQAANAGGGQADLSVSPVRAEFALSSDTTYAPGPLVVPFDVIEKSDPAFILNGDGSVTVNFTGEVKVVYELEQQVTNNRRTQARARLELNTVIQNHTATSYYMRQANHGASASCTKTFSVTNGDTFRVATQRTAGGGTCRVEFNGCRFIFERIG